MRFLYPAFLFCLLAIIIPIIIHLFSFKRYKTVYFSNVNFLKDIKKESKKKSRLKQLLILAARILTIVFLVFAFAQPYFPINKKSQTQLSQTIGIYIDNSFSMNALSAQGQLLEVARNKALEISMAYPTGTKFRLFTNDFNPKHAHLLNKDQLIQQVSELQASPTVVPMSLIYNRFSSENASKQSNNDLYFISDFQRSITDIPNFTEANISSYYIPLTPNNIANLYIDSCWVEVPAHGLNQEENMFVRIKNSSDQDYQNLPLKLYINDSIKSITNFSVSAQNQIIANLKYNNNTSGYQLGKIEITDYPFTHDNNWYISYFVEPKLKVLAIYSNKKESKEGLKYLSALFYDDDYVNLDKMDIKSLQINKISNYNAIFLLSPENFSSGFLKELKDVVSSGSSVVLFPNMKSKNNNIFLSQFNSNSIVAIDSTKQEISNIDFDNKFYANAFKKKEKSPILPEIKGHFRFQTTTRSSEHNLLSFRNGDKALSLQNYNNGKVWIFSFPLNKENETFARDIIFVPTIYNIVLNSLPKQEIAFTVGKNNFVNLSQNLNIDYNSTIEIENPETGRKFIPAKSISGKGTRLDFSGQITNAGHYTVKNNSNTVAAMAFNYNRLESDLRYFTQNELKSKLQEQQITNATVIEATDRKFSEIFEDLQKGKQYWKLCIVLALLFLFSEVMISRFWK